MNGLIQSFGALGAFIGSFFVAFFLKYFSYRQALIVTDLIGIVGCLIFLGPNLAAFLIARLVCGFVVGLNTALVPVFINDFTPLGALDVCGALH